MWYKTEPKTSVTQVDVPQLCQHLGLLRIGRRRRRCRPCRCARPRVRLRRAGAARARGLQLELRFCWRNAAVGKSKVAHLLEAPTRLEPPAVPRVVHPLVHLVNLLQTDLARLEYHAPHKGDGDDAKGAPHKKHTRPQVDRPGLLVHALGVHHEGCGVRNGKVEEPVGRCGYRHGLGAHLEGVDLRRDDPHDGAPRGRKEKDVNRHKDDEDLVLDRQVVVPAGRGIRRDEELADGHADGTHDEQPPSTPRFDHDEAGKCRDAVDDLDDECDHEGVRDFGPVEKRGSVIHDKVDAG